MTQIEKLKALFDEMEIPYSFGDTEVRLGDHGQNLTKVGDGGKLDYYSGFFCVFNFDENGQLKQASIGE